MSGIVMDVSAIVVLRMTFNFPKGAFAKASSLFFGHGGSKLDQQQ